MWGYEVCEHCIFYLQLPQAYQGYFSTWLRSQQYPDQPAPVARRCLALFCQVPLTLSTSSHFAGQKSHLTGTVAPAAIHESNSASKACLSLLPLHDEDETPNCGSHC